MKCDNCGKEETWIEVIGSSFICRKCISKHKIMGTLLRTHMDTFQFVMKKLKIKDYKAFMAITREQIEGLVNLRKIGIKLDTTNIVEIE